MCNEIKFPILEKFESYEFNKVEEVLASEPITLQDKPWTAEFKLNDLSAEYVLSFILTNDVKDIKGTKNSTVIFRNGVTATAAKKLPNKKLSWFYHGKPLNNGDMLLNITVTKKQFLFSYQDESTNGEWIIHGDTPLTRFDKKVVGDLSNQNFYLVIFVKNKNKKLRGKFSLGQTFTNVGYIHKASEQSE